MLRSTKAAAVALALTTGALVLASPAEAVTDFANCDAMHRVFPAGVSISKKAANKQYNTGHKRPAVKPDVYRVNDESDADHDGTACEVSR